MRDKKIGDILKLTAGEYKVVNFANIVNTPIEYKEEFPGHICQYCGKQDVKVFDYLIIKMFHVKNKIDVKYIGISDCGRILELPKEQIAPIYDTLFKENIQIIYK